MPVKSIHNLKNDDLDVLIAYMQDSSGSVKLTLKQEEKIARYHFCYDLIYRYGSKRIVTKMLIKKYDYSRATAYADYSDTQALFGATTRVEKDFEKQWAAEILKQAIMQALDAGEYKALASLMKELRITLGYADSNAELPDFSKFELPKVTIGFFPEQVGIAVPTDEARIKEMIAPFLRVKEEFLKSDFTDANVVE